jgi:hypothetical protein
MGYLSDLIYHTDVLVQLVSILYHVGPRGMGYLSDLIYYTDVLVQLVSILYHVGPRGMGYLSDLIYHTDVLVQLVSISFSFKLFWLSDLSTFGVSGDGCSGDSSCAVIMAVEAIEAFCQV